MVGVALATVVALAGRGGPLRAVALAPAGYRATAGYHARYRRQIALAIAAMLSA